MNIKGKLTMQIFAIMLTLGLFSMAAVAGGPPLKDKACMACHNDFSKIVPKNHPDVIKDKGAPCLTCHAPDPAAKEPSKFSAEVHKIHRDGKAKLECSSCHAL